MGMRSGSNEGFVYLIEEGLRAGRAVQPDLAAAAPLHVEPDIAVPNDLAKHDVALH